MTIQRLFVHRTPLSLTTNCYHASYRRAEEKEHIEELQRAHEAEKEKQLALLKQLLEDKKQLTAQNEQLAVSCKEAKDLLEKRATTERDRMAVEIQRQREVWAVQEKQKRERWQAMKEKQIKDMTAKAIQPEVERLLEKHKRDCQDLQEANEREVKRVRELLQAEHEEEMQKLKKNLRQQHENETEALIESMKNRNKDLGTNYEEQVCNHFHTLLYLLYPMILSLSSLLPLLRCRSSQSELSFRTSSRQRSRSVLRRSPDCADSMLQRLKRLHAQPKDDCDRNWRERMKRLHRRRKNSKRRCDISLTHSLTHSYHPPIHIPYFISLSLYFYVSLSLTVALCLSLSS